MSEQLVTDETKDTRFCDAESFRGKLVTDKHGISYGKVKHIHINSDTLAVTGITVHEGFKKDYFLNREYIERITKKTVHLRIPPVRNGVRVEDIDGNKIGSVKKVIADKNSSQIDSIIVSTGFLRSKKVSKDKILGVGQYLILTGKKADYKRKDRDMPKSTIH